jgi:TonB family protein
MRLPSPVAIALLFLFALGPAQAAPPADSHIFSGEVKSVDLAAKTITIASGGQRFVFHVTPETKLSGSAGYVTLGAIKPGQGAVIMMRLGPGNVGIALKIHISADALGPRLTSYYSAKTIDGSTVHGNAVGNYVAYEPPPDEWSTSLEYRRHNGAMFVLAVARDGTVSDVRPLASLGYSELDARAMRWFKRWKFRPNSVTEVRMPMVYTYSRR